ncbi:MAG: hypothetical protein IKC12_03990 [Alistipes sp.]|nr:hypothetical protein [Alistipes sp.]
MHGEEQLRAIVIVALGWWIEFAGICGFTEEIYHFSTRRGNVMRDFCRIELQI